MAWSRAWIEPVKSIEVVDEYTVKWTFNKPWGSFLGIMANVPGYAMSAKALKGDVALKESKALARKAERAKKKVAREEKKAKKAERKGGTRAQRARAKLEVARKKAAALEKQARDMAVLAKEAKDMDSNPVGTGKFMLEEGSPGNSTESARDAAALSVFTDCVPATRRGRQDGGNRVADMATRVAVSGVIRGYSDGHLQSLFHVFCLHGFAQTPSDNVPGIIIENR